MPHLTITPTPYRSSRLAVPPSPFSPRLPISPPPQVLILKPTKPQTKVDLATPPPPPKPLRWLWQCHVCSRMYHLGVTRRCLDDRHFFCAGAPILKRDRKTGQMVRKKGRACASEFDYAGWKAWGNWRRDVEEQREMARALLAFDGKGESADVLPRPPLFAAARPMILGEGEWLGGAWMKKASVKPSPPKKNCWGTCDYPSECRWGKQYGAQQSHAQTDASAAPAAVEANVAASNAENANSKTKFEDILVSIPATIEESSETGTCCKAPSPVSDEIRKPNFDDLLESAKRRKRRSASTPPSPLAPHSVSEESSKETVVVVSSDGSEACQHSLQRAFDDFELDARKSFEKASGLLGGLVSRWKDERVEVRKERKRKGRRADDAETRSLSD